MGENLKGSSEPPGCRCRVWERPDVNGKIMRGGIDDCPWHGFGTVGVSHLELGERQYSITGAMREVLDRRRNGLDFGVEQVVLLRWQAEQQRHHLMWVRGYSWRNVSLRRRDGA